MEADEGQHEELQVYGEGREVHQAIVLDTESMGNGRGEQLHESEHEQRDGRGRANAVPQRLAHAIHLVGLRPRMDGTIVAYGFPSFCVQAGMAAVNFVLNFQLVKYGALSPIGADEVPQHRHARAAPAEHGGKAAARYTPTEHDDEQEVEGFWDGFPLPPIGC